jgi:hypothetical protein
MHRGSRVDEIAATRIWDGGPVTGEERRLPGERRAETSPFADDIQLWAGVYAELSMIQRDWVGRMERDLRRGLPPEITRSELTAAQELLAWMTRRLEYWNAREDKLH